MGVPAPSAGGTENRSVVSGSSDAFSTRAPVTVTPFCVWSEPAVRTVPSTLARSLENTAPTLLTEPSAVSVPTTVS